MFRHLLCSCHWDEMKAQCRADGPYPHSGWFTTLGFSAQAMSATPPPGAAAMGDMPGHLQTSPPTLSKCSMKEPDI